MDYSQIMNLFFSFLGGGLVAALLNWIRVARSESRATKAARIQSQLEKLYGPLYFLASQAEQLIILSNRHSEGYRVEYIEGNRGASGESQKVISINKEYAHRLQNISKESVEVMKNAYSYIDPVDNELFQSVVIDSIRLEVEREESGKLKTPLEIYKHVGDMYFYREEFIELIKRRFLEKREELKNFECLPYLAWLKKRN